MNPGDLNKRIVLLKRSFVLDSLKQEIATFSEFGTIWAMYRSNRADEGIESGREQMAKEGRFVVRWSKRLQQFIDDERATFEIALKGKYYNVKSAVNDDEANKTFTFVVEVRE